MASMATCICSKFHGRAATAFPRLASASSRAVSGESRLFAPPWNSPWHSRQKPQACAVARLEATVSRSCRVTPAHFDALIGKNDRRKAG